jgi:hypothetical protein
VRHKRGRCRALIAGRKGHPSMSRSWGEACQCGVRHPFWRQFYEFHPTAQQARLSHGVRLGRFVRTSQAKRSFLIRVRWFCSIKNINGQEAKNGGHRSEIVCFPKENLKIRCPPGGSWYDAVSASGPARFSSNSVRKQTISSTPLGTFSGRGELHSRKLRVVQEVFLT